MPEVLVVARRARGWPGAIAASAVVLAAIGARGGRRAASPRSSSPPAPRASPPAASAPATPPPMLDEPTRLERSTLHARGRLADRDPFRACQPDRLVEVPFEIVDGGARPPGTVVEVWFGCAPPGARTFLEPGAVYQLHVTRAGDRRR